MRLGSISLWGDDVDAFRRQVRLAEELGYEVITVGDSPSAWHDVYVSLALAAAEVERATLATMVTAPFLRHPMMTARAVASLDALTGGRMILGIGLGGSATASIGRGPARLSEMRDYVNAVRDLLNGEPVTWEGTRTAPLVHARPVPIYIAAEGPKALRLAGEIGDGVIVSVGADMAVVDRHLADVRAGAEAAGRSGEAMDVWALTYVSIAETRQRALEDIAAFLAVNGGLGMHRPHYRALVPPELEEPIERLMAAYSTAEHVVVGGEQAKLVMELGLADFLAGLTALAGTPEVVAQDMAELEKRGFSTVLLPLPGNADPEGMLHRLRDITR